MQQCQTSKTVKEILKNNSDLSLDLTLEIVRSLLQKRMILLAQKY
jgi:hypothetical protein